MKKAIYICIGVTAMVLGTIGTVLPGLPTTPFLLLALLCFTKGSEKLMFLFLSLKPVRRTCRKQI